MFLFLPRVNPNEACPIASILSDAARSACEQTPFVPVWILATCDYGYVLLLFMTHIFLPKAPPIHVDYELRPIAHHSPEELAAAHHPPQLERHNKSALVQKVVRKFKDSGEEHTVTVSTRR